MLTVVEISNILKNLVLNFNNVKYLCKEWFKTEAEEEGLFLRDRFNQFNQDITRLVASEQLQEAAESDDDEVELIRLAPLKIDLIKVNDTFKTMMKELNSLLYDENWLRDSENNKKCRKRLQKIVEYYFAVINLSSDKHENDAQELRRQLTLSETTPNNVSTKKMHQEKGRVKQLTIEKKELSDKNDELKSKLSHISADLNTLNQVLLTSTQRNDEMIKKLLASMAVAAQIKSQTSSSKPRISSNTTSLLRATKSAANDESDSEENKENSGSQQSSANSSPRFGSNKTNK